MVRLTQKLEQEEQDKEKLKVQQVAQLKSQRDRAIEAERERDKFRESSQASQKELTTKTEIERLSKELDSSQQEMARDRRRAEHAEQVGRDLQDSLTAQEKHKFRIIMNMQSMINRCMANSLAGEAGLATSISFRYDLKN